MKTTKKQLETLLRGVTRNLCTLTSLPHDTVKQLHDICQQANTIIEELDKQVKELPDFEKYVEKQNFEYRYFCKKFNININSRQIPENMMPEWNKALKDLADKNPEISGQIKAIELNEFDFNFKPITDLTGFPVIMLFNYPELFKI